MFAGLIRTGSVPVDPFDPVDGWVLQGISGLPLAVESPQRTFLGWEHSEVLGMAARGMIHPDDDSVVRQARLAALDGGGEHQARFRFRTTTDEWLWVEGNFVGVADPHGRSGALSVATIRTVTEPHLDRGVLELTAELASTLASASTDTDAWHACLDRIARLTGAEAALVWQPSGPGLSVQHWWRNSAASAPMVVIRSGSWCSDPNLALGRAWSSGEVIDADVDEVCAGADVGHLLSGHRSLLVPLRSDARTNCIVELVRPTGSTCADLTVHALQGIGDTVARRNLERELSPDELSFRLIFQEASIGMSIVAIDGTFLAVNEALCRFLGRSQGDLVGMGFGDLTFGPDLAGDEAVITDLMAGRVSNYQYEKRFVHADGTAKWAMLSVSLVRRRGEPLHFIAQISDIGGLKRAEVELTRAMATFRAGWDHSGIGMAIVRLDGPMPGELISANAAFAAITRSTVDEVTKKTIGEVIRTADRDRIDEYIHQALTDDEAMPRDEFRIDSSPESSAWIRLVIAPVRDHSTGDRVAVAQIEDITVEREAQEQLAHLALHDSLTGLPNRALIMDRIHTAQRRSMRSGTRFGILFADLDKFKNVNDSFGHEAGDQLLRTVADRFRADLRPGDTAARIGGDEFVMLCEGLSPDDSEAAAELEAIAERLHSCLRAPVLLDSREVFVTISIGMNVVDGPDDDVRTLLSNADTAMYRAKARGRSRSETYDATLRMEAIDRLRIDSELHHAIERDQLTVVYQPIVELPSGRVRGAEALLRWHHPELGHVRPDLFIDVAEDSELIVDLGDFVMDRVGLHLSHLAQDDFYVTANVSARQLSRTDFVDTVEKTLERHRLAPHQLAVELTENVLMDAAGSSLGQLNSLRSLGVRVGVDDFGTGYASLTYLKQLPVSFVKIDRSFVSGLVDDADDRTIADAVIGLAAALDLDVVAEGVETEKQAEILTELGCTYAQGYLYGRPAAPTSS